MTAAARGVFPSWVERIDALKEARKLTANEALVLRCMAAAANYILEVSEPSTFEPPLWEASAGASGGLTSQLAEEMLEFLRREGVSRSNAREFFDRKLSILEADGVVRPRFP